MKLNLPIKIAIIILATLLMLFIMFYSVMSIVIFVPSDFTGRIIVTKLMEDDKTAFIPRIFMDEEELIAFLTPQDTELTNSN